jgi:hypothetical protein
MPIILATQEAEIRRIAVQSRKYFVRPCLEKIHHKKGLGEYPSIASRRRRRRTAIVIINLEPAHPLSYTVPMPCPAALGQRGL